MSRLNSRLFERRYSRAQNRAAVALDVWSEFGQGALLDLITLSPSAFTLSTKQPKCKKM